MTHTFQYYCYNDNTPRNYYSLLPNKEQIADIVALYSEDMINKMNYILSTMKNVLPKECISFIEKFYTEKLNNYSGFYRLRCNKVISKKY